MPAPTPRLRAFTLIEMLVVMAVIAVLAAILLNLNGLVQSKAARTRALGEIQTLESGCKSYQADNGSYPQDAITDVLDPRVDGDPNKPTYRNASLTLYKQLSGDLNADGRNDPNATPPEPKSYLADFFTPQRMGVDANKTVGTANWVLYIKDPYSNSYGYSTMGAAAEQIFRKNASTDPLAKRDPQLKGYNPTFDLWSTAGKTTLTDPNTVNAWVKNW